MNGPNNSLKPRDIIEKIRTEVYLLDIEKESEQIRNGARNLQIQLNNALKLLSEDLYSKKSHFVLELVQNADDNNYPPGVVPKLIFSLTPEQLVLINNEVGFSEPNVQALCRVGQSSKANKSGYIGEKGIGFKSVFTVSNAPEIHSNGYHFRFDRRDEANLLGYVVPQWCEPPEEANPKVTTIILPAADDFEFSRETLEDLDARLLLFLSKIREVTLQHDEKKVTYRRRDKDGLSYLTTEVKGPEAPPQSEENRYVRVAVDYPMTEYPDEKRSGVLKSSLVLAFPVDSDGAASPEPSSKVFAFLPIRQVGFRFSIQADFILSSSREDILTDRPWNKFLRAAISAAFKIAISSFKKTDELAFSYLKYLPATGEISDPFFKPVAESILKALAQAESLPSAAGLWTQPSALRIAGKSFRDLFSSKVSLELFGFDYVDARVQASNELLRQLGVKDVLLSDVLSVFGQHGTWLRQQPVEWKARFFAYVASLDLSALIKAGLTKLPCVPTNTGDFVIPDQTSVFYPLSKGKKYGFEHELVIVDSELVDRAGQLSERVPGLFTELKVKSDDPYHLVTSHILPKHRDESWMNSEDKALIGHLRYVKDKLKSYLEGAALAGTTEAQAFKTLREGMWLGTKHNIDDSWSFDRANTLYLSKEYKSRFCMESLLGDAIADSRLVSPAYLDTKAKNPAAETESWREFLYRLGVCFSPSLQAIENGDWQCSEELLFLLGSSQSSVRKATLERIDQNWNHYAGRLTYNLQVGRAVNARSTQFVLALRATQAPTKKKATVPLSEAFYPTQEILDLFGDRLPYVDAAMSISMLDHCGTTHRLDAKACIKRLTQLKAEGGDTIKQLQAIYRHLERLWDSDNEYIKLTFASQGLIRVKGAHPLWANPSQVAWRSNGLFLDSLYPPLQGQYKDFSGFFLNKLGIPKDLPTAKWVEALSELGKVATIEERRREALAIYKRANRDLTPHFGRDDVPTPSWLHTFEDDDVFLNHRGELVPNDELLFANDAPDLASLFSDSPDVSFLDVSSEEVPRIGRLLEATNVQRLSTSVVVGVVEAAGGRLDTELTNRTRCAASHLGRVLYAKSHESFENALEHGLFLRLRELEVIEVPELKLSVTIGETSRITTASIARDMDQIFIKAGTRSVNDQLATELCKFLDTSEDLADTFARVLMAEDAESAEDFLTVRRIGALPTDLQEALKGGAGPLLQGKEQEASLGSEEDETAAEPDADDLPTDMRAPIQGETSAAPSPSPVTTTLPSESSGTTGTIKEPTTAPSAVARSPGGISAPTMPTSSPGASTGVAGNGQSDATQIATRPPTDSANFERDTTGTSELREKPPSGNEAGDAGAGSDHSAPPEVTGNPMLTNNWRSPGEASAGTRRKSGRSQRPRTKSGRLMSYAAAPGDSGRPNAEDDPAKAAAREATGKAAVEHFIATQADRWKSLTSMPHNNPGFDVHAVAHDGSEEFIEVKGQSAGWTEDGVALTPKELETAQEKRERYWLCVVEHVYDDKRRALYLVQNPYGLTQQFRFDSGWKTASINETAVPLKPSAGMCIDIPEAGRGRIQSVRKKGLFFGLHVILDSGRQMNTLFNPAKMKLSVE